MNIVGLILSINERAPNFFTFTINTGEVLISFWTQEQECIDVLNKCTKTSTVKVTYTKPNNHCTAIEIL